MSKSMTILLSLLIVIIIFIAIFMLIKTKINISNNVVLEGIIQEVYENSIIIQPTDDSIQETIASISLGNVQFDGNEQSRLQPGIKIKVIYDGSVLESYPVQIIAKDINFFD